MIYCLVQTATILQKRDHLDCQAVGIDFRIHMESGWGDLDPPMGVCSDPNDVLIMVIPQCFILETGQKRLYLYGDRIIYIMASPRV